MPTKVKRTLLVTNKDDAKTYLNADGVSLGITSLVIIYWRGFI